ncbi:MAG: amino acid ABC transporter substrate-binding protein [Desulfobacteraceae bacterium]|nr:amino acid ABC transporter substrate-binding protein [Desulfobacteraceae bacterium]
MKTLFLIVMTFMLFCSQAHGESFKLLSAEIPPFTSETREAEGFCIDLVRELFKRSGMGLEIQFLPWARAQYKVRTAPEGKALLITPLTRVPKREAFYDWILPLYEYKLQLITNDGSVPVHDEAAMKAFEICVLRESPAQYKLEEKGFKKVYAATTELKCLQLLKHERTKAVLVHGIVMGIHNYKAFDGDPKELIRGIAYPGRALYLAAPKGAVSKKMRDKLQRAMEKMKSDGTYDAILGKYMN